MKKQLDPRAVWLFFIQFVLRQSLVIVAVGFYAVVILLDLGSDIDDSAFGFLWWLLAVVPLTLVIGYVWAKLSYHFYRYEITDDGFRKEFGIIWKKYVTIPYDRIQNVDIYRGVVARLLGLSDLHIQTAGASAQYSRHGAWGLSAEGRLPGLSREEAEQLRDELVRRAKGSTRQGL